MNFKFIEKSVIVIPFVYSGYRLEGAEKVRFRCLFKNAEGDFPYTLDLEEDNKETDDADGKYTITLDMSKYDILPGRYAFDLSLVLESGSFVTLKSKTGCHIDVVPEVEGLYKPNGDIYFGADYIVEVGVTDGLRYFKKSSGDAECWGIIQLTAEKVNVLSIGLTEIIATFAAPALFTNCDCIHVSPYHYYNIGGRALYRSGTNNLEMSAILLSSSVPDFTVGDTLFMNITIKGRWK